MTTATPAMSAVISGMVHLPSRNEAWCSETPGIVTIRDTSSSDLEVIGTVALTSKGMPLNAAALCLAVVPNASAESVEGEGDLSGNSSAESKNQGLEKRQAGMECYIWSSWTSGHIIIICPVRRVPVKWMRWDAPHPIHSLLAIPVSVPSLKNAPPPSSPRQIPTNLNTSSHIHSTIASSKLSNRDQQRKGGGSRASQVSQYVVVGVALDGCLSLWDTQSCRVLTTLSTGVGSKCPLRRVVVTPSRQSGQERQNYKNPARGQKDDAMSAAFDEQRKGGSYVYCGFDDGSIRAFLIKVYVSSAQQKFGRFRATIESSVARSHLNVHPRSSILSLVIKVPSRTAGGGTRQTASTKHVGGDSRSETDNSYASVIEFWSGGEDGTLRCSSLSLLSNKFTSEVVLFTGDLGNGDDLDLEEEEEEDGGYGPADPMLTGQTSSRRRNHQHSSSTGGGGSGGYCHKAAACGSYTQVAATSDGVLYILNSDTKEVIQRVQFQQGLCVREVLPLLVTEAVGQSPRRGQMSFDSSPPAQTQYLRKVLLSMSDGSLRNVSLRISPEELDQDLAAGLLFDSSSAGSAGGKNGKTLLVSGEEDAMEAYGPNDDLLEQDTETSIQQAFRLVGQLQEIQESQQDGREKIEAEHLLELSHLHEMRECRLWGGLSKPSANYQLAEARWCEERLLEERVFFREREQFLMCISDLQYFSVSVVEAQEKLVTCQRDCLEGIQSLAREEQERFGLLSQLEAAERKVTDSSAMSAVCEEMKQELSLCRQEMEHATEQEGNLTAGLEILLQEQRQVISSRTSDLVETEFLLKLTEVLHKETTRRSQLQQEQDDFWRDIVLAPSLTMYRLYCDSLLLDSKAMASSTQRQLVDVALLRESTASLEDAYKKLELEHAATLHAESRMAEEKTAVMQELEISRQSVRHCESEVVVLKTRLNETEGVLSATESKLTSAMQLAEDSCQTVSDQAIIVTQLRRKASVLSTAVGELLRACRTQLLTGVKNSHLTHAKATLQEVMYDVAAMKRNSPAGPDGPTTTSVDQSSGATNPFFSPSRIPSDNPLSSSGTVADVTFEKVRSVLLKHLEPFSKESVVFSKDWILMTVDKIEEAIRLSDEG